MLHKNVERYNPWRGKEPKASIEYGENNPVLIPMDAAMRLIRRNSALIPAFGV
jgi:hypothetical protein